MVETDASEGKHNHKHHNATTTAGSLAQRPDPVVQPNPETGKPSKHVAEELTPEQKETAAVKAGAEFAPKGHEERKTKEGEESPVIKMEYEFLPKEELQKISHPEPGTDAQNAHNAEKASASKDLVIDPHEQVFYDDEKVAQMVQKTVDAHFKRPKHHKHHHHHMQDMTVEVLPERRFVYPGESDMPQQAPKMEYEFY